MLVFDFFVIIMIVFRIFDFVGFGLYYNFFLDNIISYFFCVFIGCVGIFEFFLYYVGVEGEFEEVNLVFFFVLLCYL